MRRLALAIICVGVVGISSAGASAAVAAPGIELTRGSVEPAESITTQLGAVVTNGGGYVFQLDAKPTGGEGCGANPNADRGETVISSDITSETNPVSFSQNWTFRPAGNYRLCAWVVDWLTREEVLASAETTLYVRAPHLALSISAPPAVAPGQTFQILTTAQAETEREVREYVIRSTGDGCPANADAANNASGSSGVLFWNVTGGPFTESRNVSLSAYGNYLVCAYFEYPSTESPPELVASTQMSVVPPPPPCVVPSFALGSSLVSVETSLHVASCSVGAIHYAASTRVRRGGVIGLSPRPGTTLGAGAPVVIDVSAGPPCIVPSVRAGQNVQHVEHWLAAAGCRAVIVHARNGHVRRDAVIGLGSRPRARLFPLTRVPIIVSRGR